MTKVNIENDNHNSNNDKNDNNDNENDNDNYDNDNDIDNNNNHNRQCLTLTIEDISGTKDGSPFNACKDGCLKKASKAKLHAILRVKDRWCWLITHRL
jgi:hypothetical protein